MTLSDRDRAVLDIEATFWRTTGAKTEAIRGLNLTATRYYQILNQLLDNPDALAYAPTTINRLRRLRKDPRRGSHHRQMDEDRATRPQDPH